MDKLMSLIALVFTALSGLKNLNIQLQSQLAAANNQIVDQAKTIADLKTQLANEPHEVQAAADAVTAANTASAEATAKAAELQTQLDALHAQADTAAASVQAQLDTLNVPSVQDPLAPVTPDPAPLPSSSAIPVPATPG